MIPGCVNAAGRLKVRLTALAGNTYASGVRVGYDPVKGGFVYGGTSVPVYFVAGLPLDKDGRLCISTGLLGHFAPPCIPITIGNDIKESAGSTPQLFNYGQGFLAAGAICTEVV